METKANKWKMANLLKNVFRVIVCHPRKQANSNSRPKLLFTVHRRTQYPSDRFSSFNINAIFVLHCFILCCAVVWCAAVWCDVMGWIVTGCVVVCMCCFDFNNIAKKCVMCTVVRRHIEIRFAIQITAERFSSFFFPFLFSFSFCWKNSGNI